MDGEVFPHTPLTRAECTTTDRVLHGMPIKRAFYKKKKKTIFNTARITFFFFPFYQTVFIRIVGNIRGAHTIVVIDPYGGNRVCVLNGDFFCFFYIKKYIK